MLTEVSLETQMPAKSEEIEWPTLALLLATYLVWGLGTLHCMTQQQPVELISNQ